MTKFNKAQLGVFVKLARTDMEHAEKKIKEFQAQISGDTPDMHYAICWANGVVAADFKRRFCYQLIATVEADRSDYGVEDVLEDLRDAVMSGRYENHSTSAFTRAVGEVDMETARNLLETYTRKIRHEFFDDLKDAE